MTKQEAKDRQKQIGKRYSMDELGWLQKPFSQWSKEDQLSYNVLHEIAYRDGKKFSPVSATDTCDGVKYTEEEMEEARSRV